MRWLLRKDLLILRRSRLLVVLLIIYPVAIALLIGVAISRSPGKPKVAVVDLSPPGATVQLGNSKVPVARYYDQLFNEITVVRSSSRAQAVSRVSSGQALAAIVIPPDIARKLSSGLTQAQVQVIYNGDALQQSLVRSTIDSALAQANLSLSGEIRQVAARGIDLLLKGGDFSALGAPQNVLGLGQISTVLHRVVDKQPPGADRTSLERVAGFADFAAQNLGLSKKVLSTVSQPIQIDASTVHGRRATLNTYAVVVAVSISLMFICLLLAAGGVALEREENALARLVRGPPALVSRNGLLAEKALLAAGCSFVVAFTMLAGISAFVKLDWSRVGLWVAALAVSAFAFGALGVAIGALAREVRAASLLAFLLSLPLAFLALVPNGAVAAGLYDVIRAISLLFPFKAALQALDGAVNQASPSVGVSLLHLLALSALFGALARVGLRRLE
ncbi:MAG TPA: ABC transporter permease [Solirubrobacteraceae bacterium]|nr:ABC transporter permease [Solirubrobacteraceae bacterium]